MVVGCKADAGDGKGQPTEEVAAYCRDIGASHFPTSAKTGRGVREPFEFAAKDFAKRKPKPALLFDANDVNMKPKPQSSTGCC